MASTQRFYHEGMLANVRFSAPETLSGTKTLDYATDNSNIIKLDPGGSARNVVLWPEADSKGAWVWIFNAADAAENLAVKASDGSTALATINQDESGIFQCNGTAWSLLAIVAIALS